MPMFRTILSVAALAASSTLSAQVAEPRLALKGNDPISYFTDARPVKGSSTISYDFQAQRYQFSSPKNRQLFMADPARYAPQFGGFSAAELPAGKRAEADPSVFLVRNGKLYMFSSAQARTYVTRNPGLLQRAHEEWERK
jgi:YHS domain-containing protein